ncbi:MAG: LITAF-like zinc ribbon domain-containing protein [Ignavibacteria bacterium]|nr:LITAF-like zinc ribbon domain-containing protein [Ignavibacteria bacterium]
MSGVKIVCPYCKYSVDIYQTKRPGKLFFIAVVSSLLTCGLSLLLLLSKSCYEITSRCSYCNSVLHETHIKQSSYM